MPQATWYRRHRTSPPPPGRPRSRIADRVQPRALAPAERQAILDALHSGRFADLAPGEVWATLLDEGTYLGSVSTFYRLLREAGESRERRAQATHPAAVKPELAPPGRTRSTPGTSPSCTARRNGPTTTLYVILDIYSRYAVGWMVATRESAAQSQQTTASDAQEVSSWISQSKRLAVLTSDGIPAELTQPWLWGRMLVALVRVSQDRLHCAGNRIR